MEESRQTKNTVLSWTMIGVAFVAIILFLLARFVIEGEKGAAVQCQDKMNNYVSAWSEMVGNEISLSLQLGTMFGELEKDGQRFAGPEMLEYATVLTENMDIAHVLFLKNGRIMCDESGIVSSSRNHSAFHDLESGVHILMDGDSYCGEPAMVCISEMAGYGETVAVVSHLDDMAKRFRISTYEDMSFLALTDKNGVVLTVFNKFKDTDSMFIRTGNVLSAAAQGSDNEEYNVFKVKYLNNIPCAIEATCGGDARTISFAPTGVSGTYLAYGVRQNAVNKQIKAYFEDVKATVIKLGLVIVVFSIFVVSTIVYASLRSKERGRVLEDKADTDLLTELNNKAATERKIQEYIDNNPEGRGLMFILDIDNFKKINDTMGHSFGDTLLRTLGKEIRAEFRVTDIIGRTGGDEFMVFLKDVNDDLIVEREANRITRFFHDFKAGGEYVKYSASASIGAAIFPDDAKTFKSLYIAADQALYRAKKRGKNQLVFYNETVHKG